VDRQILEMRRALQQRLLRLERNVRFLKRRVRYPGAMQSCDCDDLLSFPLPSDMVVGSITVDPGRWLVITEAMLFKSVNFNGTEGLTVEQVVRSTDGSLTESTYSLTNKSAYTVHASATAMYLPVTVVRAYSFPDTRVVTMRIFGLRDVASAACNIINITFQILPF
jgi:hypothetical protein